MNTSCPNCGMETAYFDGVEFCCPDCDYTWSDNQFSFEEDDDENEED
jgi:uncharacterized Zn ribbon protein